MVASTQAVPLQIHSSLYVVRHNKPPAFAAVLQYPVGVVEVEAIVTIPMAVVVAKPLTFIALLKVVVPVTANGPAIVVVRLVLPIVMAVAVVVPIFSTPTASKL